MFGTSGVRGPFGETVTAALALDVGRALATEAGTDTVVVGRDVRGTGALLADAASAGLRECGADVVRVGVQSTPTIARSVEWLGADAGVAVTASHNPAPDNGLKLWTADGRAFGGDAYDRVAERVRADDVPAAAYDAVGTERTGPDVAARHVDRLAAAVDLPADADPPSVAVDLGTGAGQVTVGALRALGCAVRTLNAERDGEFPARPSEPTPENLADLRRTVAATEVDLGIAHDGDADRMVAVDAEGEVVAGDDLLALFAADAVDPGGTVVAPVNASLGVADAVADAGGTLVRTPVGDTHVAARLDREGGVFGGEPSGAWIWPAETYCPDGHYAACRLAELVARRGPLAELVADRDAYPTRRESVPVDDKADLMAAVRERVRERYDDVETVDGVRVELGDAWFLVRPSGTEPVVRLTAEARTADRADEALAEARSLLGDAA